ncbi:MAG: hypothetical protein AAFU77_04700 [Myxococcota bacterium]
MARDVLFATDQAMVAAMRPRMARVYQRPIFRALIFLLSPTLLFMGASSRWTAFRRGSSLETKGIREPGLRGFDIRVEYPPRLYDRLSMLEVEHGLCVALESAGAEDVHYVEKQATESSTVARITWTS